MSLVDASSIGADRADCAVCGIDTYYRLVVGDRNVPLCGDSCERAWPRVELARNALSYLIRRVQTDAEFHHHMFMTESLDRIIRARAAFGGETAEELREIVLDNEPKREARCAEDRERVEALEEALEAILDEAHGRVEDSVLDDARKVLTGGVDA